MSEDRTEIEAVVQTYLDGLYEGDVEKLAAAFHPTSSLTYEENGVLTPLPRDQWLEAVRNRPSPQVARAAPARPDPADRSSLPDDGLREAQLRDPAALLHRLPVAAEGRGPVAGRAEGVRDGAAGIGCSAARRHLCLRRSSTRAR